MQGLCGKLLPRHCVLGAGAGQYSEAAWCAVELEKASGTQADAEAVALLETAAQRRAALTQVRLEMELWSGLRLGLGQGSG